MSRSKEFTDEQLDKFPKWVQARIQDLEEERDRLKTMLSVLRTSDQVNFTSAPQFFIRSSVVDYTDKELGTRWVPQDLQCGFALGPQLHEEFKFYSRKWGDRQLLEIQGGSPLSVEPQASNLVHLSLR